MTQPAIAANVAKPGDILSNLPAKRALNGVVAVEDRRDPGDLFVRQLLGPALWLDSSLLAHSQGQRRTDAVDVAQRDVRRLVGGNVNTKDTRHGVSSSLNPGAVCAGGWCK